jgi:hypothetical protein
VLLEPSVAGSPIRLSTDPPGFTVRPRELTPDGSLRLSVAAVGYGFSGRTSSVWVSQTDLASFVAALSALEAARQGEAILLSQSPGELRLRLSSTDTAGHMRAEVTVSRIFRTRRQWETATTSFGFDFDPSRLPALLRSFQRLLGATRGVASA